MATFTAPWPDGSPCWADLAVTHLGATTRFYTDLLGWVPFDTGAQLDHYTRCRLDGRDVAALLRPIPGVDPLPWTVYFASSDTATTLEIVVANGGAVLAPPMSIPGVGTMALATDPCGAPFGIWQADGMIGFGAAGEPGTVGWVQGWFSDPALARSFYRDVFGLQEGPSPGTVGLPGTAGAAAGIGALEDAPVPGPSQWSVHFLVQDLGPAARRATAAGGALLAEGVDVPAGRCTVVRDPHGATFALLQPTR